jgi:hypothetical protein
MEIARFIKILFNYQRSTRPSPESQSYILYDLRFSQQWLWRMPSSEMWCCVVLVWTDLSEECIASIFRVKKFASKEPAWAGGCRLSHQSKIPSYENREGGIVGHMGNPLFWFPIWPTFVPFLFLWNFGSHKIYTMPHPRRRHSLKLYIVWTNT